MTRYSLLILLLFGAGLTGNGLAEPKYLAQDAIAVDVVGAPPKRGSTEDQADTTQLLDQQAHRTAKECKRAGWIAHPTFAALFGPPYGPVSKPELEHWGSFFEQMHEETNFFVRKIKASFHRSRPYVEDRRLKPCVKFEPSAAYPSEHATLSRVQARLLSQVDPSRETAFMERADQIASDRVLGGVHHPTDIEAGKKLGDILFEKLMADPSFLKDFCKVQPTQAKACQTPKSPDSTLKF